MADETKVPWPKSEEDLLQYVRALVEGGERAEGESGHNYTAESAWKAAAAMFYYMSHVFGLTGFQASWGAMQFLREVNGYKGPFGVIDGDKMLYPQYNLRQQLDEWISKWTPLMAEKAKEEIAKAERDGSPVHPNVMEHWKRLAALA